MIKKFINKIFKTDDKMSFKESLDLCSLPVVTFYQGDKKYNFLLDTGSSNSVINKDVLKSIKHTLINKASTLYGMEGNPEIVPFCSITLSFNNKDYTYEYLIKNLRKPFKVIKEESGVTLHGILGSNFFNAFKYVLDFDKLIAYSKK